MNPPPADPASVTRITVPSDHLGDVADIITRNGPDPVMLAAILICVMFMLGLMVYLIRRSAEQQDRTLKHFQTQVTQEREQHQQVAHNQRQEFRVELGTQREAHLSELTNQRETFERSLDKIVEASRESTNLITSKLGGIENRLERVEGFVVGAGRVTPVETVEVLAPVKPKKGRRKSDKPAEESA